MKITDIFRRKKKAHWVVFNQFDVTEFAECSICGHEVEPDFSEFPYEIYPTTCPRCGATMTHSEA